MDERISSVRFTDSFYHGQAKSLVTINIQRSEKITDAKGVQKSYFGSRLWKRVEQLNDITRAYIESDFVREMGRNYVKPPILRTNAILKNKYFRQCLDLWTYLQSYEESGCGLTVEETILQPDQKYVGGLFGAAAAQYLEFCRSSDERTEENILTSATSPTLNARLTLTVEDEADPVEAEDFTAVQPAAPRQPRDMAFAVQVALKAAAFYDARESNLRLEKDMEARLRLADEAAKARFAQLVDALRSYEAVKMIPRRTNYAFYLGKTVLARLTIKAGEVLLYIALEPGKLPKAFKVTDVSAVKRYAATPTLLRIKTDGQLAAARKLIERLEKKFELKKSEPEQTFDTAQYEPLPFEELLDRGLVRPAQKPERAQPAKPTPAREEIQPIVTYGEPEGEEMTPGPKGAYGCPGYPGEAGPYRRLFQPRRHSTGVRCRQGDGEWGGGAPASSDTVSRRHGLQPTGPKGSGRCRRLPGRQPGKPGACHASGGKARFSGPAPAPEKRQQG